MYGLYCSLSSSNVPALGCKAIRLCVVTEHYSN